jgi:hypothetical protein
MDKNREEMIADIICDVEDWDLENLVGWIQYELRLKLEAMTDDEIAGWHGDVFFENEE